MQMNQAIFSGENDVDENDDDFTKKRFYYRVISYARFDFPLVGDFIKIPIKGETKTIIKFKDWV